MLRIIVFDSGMGGEIVSQFLARELRMVEVVPVIDWWNAPYDDKTTDEIFVLVHEQLRRYVGRADLIVLGGYMASATLDRLRKMYPRQKFVGVSVDLSRLEFLRAEENLVLLLGSVELWYTPLMEQIQSYLPYATLVMPDCSGWEELVNAKEMMPEILRYELQEYFVLTEPERGLPSWLTREACQPIPEASATTRPARLAPNSPLREKITRFLEMTQPKRATYATAGAASGVAGANSLALASTYMEASDVGLGEYEPADAGFGGAEPRDVAAGEDIVSPSRQSFAPQHRKPLWRPEPTELYNPTAIIVLNSHFWPIEDDLAKVFGWAKPIIDFRDKLLHDVCRALELRGVDGNLGRSVGVWREQDFAASGDYSSQGDCFPQRDCSLRGDFTLQRDNENEHLELSEDM